MVTIKEACQLLGHKWGFRRPLKKAELARALAVTDQTIRNYDKGENMHPSVRVLLTVYLNSPCIPPDGLDSIRTPAKG